MQTTVNAGFCLSLACLSLTWQRMHQLLFINAKSAFPDLAHSQDIRIGVLALADRVLGVSRSNSSLLGNACVLD